MKRAHLWIIAALTAAVAATAVTFWLSPPSPTASSDQTPVARGQHGWRSRRLAPAQRSAQEEPIVHPRIAALAPGIAQVLRDLQCGGLIVGRHASDDWSDQTITVCSDQQSIDYEHLIAVNPTHVFLQWGERELPERLTTLAAERGWVLVSYPLLTLDDIAHATIAIYSAIGPMELKALRAEDQKLHPPAAQSPQQATVEYELAHAPSAVAERLDRAFASDPTLADTGSVLLLYQGAGEAGGGANDRPAALGPGSYSHDLLLRIGGKTATPTGKAFMPMDAEDIAALAPDAIVIVRPRKAGTPAPSTPPTPADLFRSLGAVARLDIPAVKSGHIAIIDDTMALVPGTNLTDFADQLRAILKGWVPEAPVAAPAR